MARESAFLTRSQVMLPVRVLCHGAPSEPRGLKHGLWVEIWPQKEQVSGAKLDLWPFCTREWGWAGADAETL